MTDGSSQGLFVIVAVVIFGIFVAISYMIFNETLKPSLASIFTDSIEKSSDILTGGRYHFEGRISEVSYDFIKEEYTLKPTYGQPVGQMYTWGMSLLEKIEVPWNHKIEISYEVYFENSNNDMWVKGGLDFNSYPENGVEGVWNGNDNYGSKTNNQTNITDVKSNTWTKVSGYYENNSPLNVEKVSIYEGVTGKNTYGSMLGLKYTDIVENNILEYKIRNIKYKVVPM